MDMIKYKQVSEVEKAQAGVIWAVAGHPSKDVMFSCSEDGTVKAWEIANQTLKLTGTMTVSGALVFSAVVYNGYLVTASSDRMLRYWGMDSYKQEKELKLEKDYAWLAVDN